jgi:hypothetical protein
MTVSPPLSGHRAADIHPLELEPRRPRDEEVGMLIDLEATREDHEEVRSLTLPGPFYARINFTVNL